MSLNLAFEDRLSRPGGRPTQLNPKCGNFGRTSRRSSNSLIVTVLQYNELRCAICRGRREGTAVGSSERANEADRNVGIIRVDNRASPNIKRANQCIPRSKFSSICVMHVRSELNAAE